jgi:hypothetical protein
MYVCMDGCVVLNLCIGMSGLNLYFSPLVNSSYMCGLILFLNTRSLVHVFVYGSIHCDFIEYILFMDIRIDTWQVISRLTVFMCGCHNY